MSDLDNRIEEILNDAPGAMAALYGPFTDDPEAEARQVFNGMVKAIHHLIQDEVIRELESLMKSGDILPYSQKQDKYHLGAARVVNIINDRISALREGKE